MAKSENGRNESRWKVNLIVARTDLDFGSRPVRQHSEMLRCCAVARLFMLIIDFSPFVIQFFFHVGFRALFSGTGLCLFSPPRLNLLLLVQRKSTWNYSHGKPSSSSPRDAFMKFTLCAFSSSICMTFDEQLNGYHVLGLEFIAQTISIKSQMKRK